MRPGKGGGLEGEFYLPREAAARLRALLDAYARPRAEGDDRSLAERQADAFIALLEQQITTELLVLVNAESLPTDPDPEPGPEPEADPDPEAASGSDPEPTSEPTTDPAADPTTETAEDPAQGGAPYDTPGSDDNDDTEDAGAAETGRQAWQPGEAKVAPVSPDSDHTNYPSEYDKTDANTTGARTSGSAVDADGTAAGGSAGLRDEESGADMTGRAQTRTGQQSWSRWGEWRSPDPPGDTHAHHTHAGPRPARAVPHAHSSSQQSSGEQGSGAIPRGEQTPDAPTAPTAPTAPEAPHPSGEAAAGGPAGPPGRTARASGGAPGAAQGAEPPPGAPGAEPGAAPGAPQGAGPGARLGAGLGMVPGLLLATGQVLPVTSVHRLARTSTLMRIIMDADGQVLDMGRKVRLATPAQRRAIFARYATCWIDGCPLPATLCQIDHADNWSTGGLTDLKLLGPACQFHNRDRYQHPHRYTRRQTGKDRWAFTYHGRTRRMQV